MSKEDAPMPITGNAAVIPLPWSIIAPHEKQALENHGQTLARLRERGGLSPCEAVAILEDRRWRRMDTAQAFTRLAELLLNNQESVR
jgi:hypothetical protein